MTTNIEVNQELLNTARELTQLKTETEIIELALQELIRTRQQRKNLLDLSGKIQFSTDYDYKALRVNRNVSD